MKKCILVLTLLTAATASNAFGDTFIQLVNMELTNVSGQVLYASSIDGGGGVYAGPYQFTINGGTPFNAMCVDPDTNINTNQTYTTQVWSLDSSDPGNVNPTSNTVTPTSGTADASGDNVSNFNNYKIRISQLVDDYYTGYFEAAFPGAPAGSSLLPSMSEYHAVGLQLAVWDLLLGKALADGIADLGIQPGSTIASGASNYADTLLKDLANHPSEAAFGGGMEAFLPINSGNPNTVSQIQGIYFTTGSGNSGSAPLPEPVGLVSLAGLAFCGLPIGANAWFRRRCKVA